MSLELYGALGINKGHMHGAESAQWGPLAEKGKGNRGLCTIQLHLASRS